MLNIIPIAPSTQLQSIVQQYFLTEGRLPEGMVFKHLIIPSLAETMYFNLSDQPQSFFMWDGREVVVKDCMITGQFLQSFETSLRGDVKLLGVYLSSPAVAQLFGIDLRQHLNNAFALEEVIGPQARALVKDLRNATSMDEVIHQVESFLLKLSSESKATDVGVLQNSLSLIKASQGKITVKELAAANHISERTLQKTFMNQMGLTPKEYIKKFRFTEVINSMSASTFSWKYVVETLGYFDQSHFLNDFKSIVGKTPSEYYKDHPEINKYFTEFIRE
ncbi:MAG: AraC family transcriptional regulator [Bacteroidota bacterium]